MTDYIPPERDPAVHPGADELRRLRHAARAWGALPVQGDDEGHRVEVPELIELEEAVAAVLSTRFVAEVAPQHPADVLEWVTTGPGGDDHRATVNALRRMAEEASSRREVEDLELVELDARTFYEGDVIDVAAMMAKGYVARTVLDRSSPGVWALGPDPAAVTVRRLTVRERAVLDHLAERAADTQGG